MMMLKMILLFTQYLIGLWCNFNPLYDESFEKELIVTEDVKEKTIIAPFDGPTKLIKELKESNEWELFNFFNNGVMKEKNHLQLG